MTNLIDFTPVREKHLRLQEFAAQFSQPDLIAATHASIDLLLAIIEPADDAAIAYLPVDPNAHDPYAVAGEEQIGWSLGHLVAHVTASSEENAALASLLARGIPYPREPRLRYETPWQQITTKAAAVQRLEESRRMRLGYLATFPDQPFLDVLRDSSDRYRELFGEQNAIAAVLFGLYHEWQHYDQFRDVLKQALAAAQPAGD